jgi:hypothetical protein
MPTPDITIKRNDAGKVLTGQLKDGDGVAVDCSSNTSRKILMKRGSTLKINSTFTFTNAATGSWSYTLQAADVDTKGKYKMELEVTLAGGQTLTFPTHPTRKYLIVQIVDDLG